MTSYPASQISRKTAEVFCRWFDPTTATWYDGAVWTDQPGNATLYSLERIVLDNIREDRFVGDIPVPPGGTWTLEYLDSLTMAVIDEAAGVNAPDADAVPPTITMFALPATSNSLTVPVLAFMAKDNSIVTAYQVTFSNVPPGPSGPGWLPSPPLSVTFTSEGNCIAYAWVMGLSGNVSSPHEAVTVVTLSPANTTGALIVRADYPEYSRFETSRKIVTARVVVPRGTGSGRIIVTLKKNSGMTVAEITNDYVPSMAETLQFQFDLSLCKDASGFATATTGEYYVAAQVDGATSTSSLFHVSLITVHALKSSYCAGLPLIAREVLVPKRQPTLVSGMIITGVSHGVKAGLHTLSLTVTAQGKTVRWDKGPTVILDQYTVSEFLPDERGNYVEVTIDWYLLPGTTCAEVILLDFETIRDETLRAEINRAASELERLIGTFLEPTRVATEPYYLEPADGEHFDRRGIPATFYRGDVFPTNAKVWHLNLPYTHVQKVYQLEGFFGDFKTLDITAGVFKTIVRQGVVEVLPQSSSYAMIITVFAQLDYWGVREYISDFWRYKALVGIAETEPDLLKVVGYMAAIPILTIAGQALRGGIASESISKDGVSRSTSVSQGLYGDAIKQYSDWLDKNRGSISNRYRGINMVVI